jgi:hypothetical protein
MCLLILIAYRNIWITNDPSYKWFHLGSRNLLNWVKFTRRLYRLLYSVLKVQGVNEIPWTVFFFWKMNDKFRMAMKFAAFLALWLWCSYDRFRRLTGRSEVAVSAQDYKFYSPRHKFRRVLSNIPGLAVSSSPCYASKIWSTLF